MKETDTLFKVQALPIKSYETQKNYMIFEEGGHAARESSDLNKNPTFRFSIPANPI